MQVALVAAILLLTTIPLSIAQAAEAAKNWTITVGPKACSLKENSKLADTQTISKRKQHRIAWQSNAGQTLSIIVHAPANCPAPFKRMTGTGTDSNDNRLWAIDCKKGKCSSGPPVSEACEQSYKYDQVLGGESCDGTIIIEK
jgi:hypothetical protein